MFEAASLEETREALKTHAIDLIFLDVQLKDGNAFDLLGNLNENTRVIFTTGYDSFAVRAFEVNALDYLLKPVQNDRLARAIQVFSDQSKRNKTLPLIRPDDDILLQENGVTRFVPISELIYVKSEKDYTQVHTTTRSWFIRRAIGAWEQQFAGHPVSAGAPILPDQYATHRKRQKRICRTLSDLPQKRSRTDRVQQTVWDATPARFWKRALAETRCPNVR